MEVIRLSWYGLNLRTPIHVTLPLSLILIGIDINLEEFFVFSRIIRINTMEAESIITNCCRIDSNKKLSRGVVTIALL